MTVKLPTGGTRGLRLPRFLARLGNRMMLRQFRRGGARTQGGVETLMLEDGRRIGVRVETLEGPDLAAAWQRLEREAPEYPKYRTKTDRQIAILRLRRR